MKVNEITKADGKSRMWLGAEYCEIEDMIYLCIEKPLKRICD